MCSTSFTSLLTQAALIYSAFSFRDAIPTSDHSASSSQWPFQFFYFCSELGTTTTHSCEHPPVYAGASDALCSKSAPSLTILKPFYVLVVPEPSADVFRELPTTALRSAS